MKVKASDLSPKTHANSERWRQEARAFRKSGRLPAGTYRARDYMPGIFLSGSHLLMHIYLPRKVGTIVFTKV